MNLTLTSFPAARGTLRRYACPIGFFLGCLAWALAPRAVEAATVEENTVFSYPNHDPYDRSNLYGFNHAASIVSLPDGRLLSAWFSGPFEASLDQVILGAFSRDGGKTWSKATTLGALPHVSNFDPAFITKGNTTWLFFSAGRWNRYPFVGMPETEKLMIGTDSFRTYVRKSTDSGRTWSKTVLAFPDRCFCRSNGIVLKNGSMLLPVYDELPLYDSHHNLNSVTSVLRSEDGVTWRRVGHVQGLGGDAADEPAIAELDDGSVLVAMRANDSHVWFSRSADAGSTWSEPTPSDFVADESSSALFRTKAGKILLAYDASKPSLRSPLVIRVLDQQHMTWSPPLVQVAHIAAPKKGSNVWLTEVSYPSMAESRDGAIAVVFTQFTGTTEELIGDIHCVRVTW